MSNRLLQASPCSGPHPTQGFHCRLQEDLCSTLEPPWATGAPMSHQGLDRLQGNRCCGTWSTSHPCFCTAVSCLYSHSSLSRSTLGLITANELYLIGSEIQGKLLVASHIYHPCSPLPCPTCLKKKKQRQPTTTLK